MPASRPTGSARTSCATPSPPICCRAAPICARCRRCSATPTSRPPRSTPMSTARGWSSWSTPRHPLADARALTPPQLGLPARRHADLSRLRKADRRARDPRRRAARDGDSGAIDIDAEIGKLEAKADRLLRDTYAKLTPGRRRRSPAIPTGRISRIMSPAIADDFMPLAGDRAFADDPAIIGGLARIDGRRVMLIGHEKGDDTASRLKHNFGMAKPEGYRKAIRLMQLADRFGLPVVTLVDTPGAFPGRRRPRSAARPRRSPARPSNAWRSACRWSRRSSARAARAARSRSPPPTAC